MYTILLVPSVKNRIQIEVELGILNKLPTLNYLSFEKNFLAWMRLFKISEDFIQFSLQPRYKYDHGVTVAL